MFYPHDRLGHTAFDYRQPGWWGWHTLIIPTLFYAGYHLGKAVQGRRDEVYHHHEYHQVSADHNNDVI